MAFFNHCDQFSNRLDLNFMEDPLVCSVKVFFKIYRKYMKAGDNVDHKKFFFFLF